MRTLESLNHRLLLKTVVFSILLVLIWYNGHQGLAAKTHETCTGINETKAALVVYIEQQLDRAQKSLPTIEYYQQHPVELGKALKDIELQRQQTREAFAPSNC